MTAKQRTTAQIRILTHNCLRTTKKQEKTTRLMMT